MKNLNKISKFSESRSFKIYSINTKNRVVYYHGLIFIKSLYNNKNYYSTDNNKNLDSNTTRSDIFLEYIGTVRGKIVPGIYIWTHLVTGDMYVGSSSRLARRLIGYFNNTHRSTGKLIPLLKKEGVGAFKLEVIPLIESYTKNQELILEQYFLLNYKFNLNTLKVVNNISGARSKNLYMYTKNKSELIYWSDVQEDFIYKLGVHHSSFSSSLKTGAIYLNKYIFTDKPFLDVKISDMSEIDIKNMLDKDRLEVRSNEKTSRKVLLKAVDDSNNTKLFDSIKDCIYYLNTIAPSNKTTLYRRIEAKQPYNGFLCQWESEETIPLRNKALQISITDISSGKTEIYYSMREAALSFAPEYNTTGQTLKAYADSEKLLFGLYKITYSKNNQ